MDAIQALQEELRRRQGVLSQSNVNDIDGYNFLRRQRPHMEPMPYIIIVADEFANVFLSNYSFAQKLFETVNLSDNLGLHLLFATHETDRILIDQLRNITGFRLCFQVSNAEESQRVIGRQDAAKLSYPGQAYFQTGQGGVFTPLEQVRIAWSDAIYDPQGYAHAHPDLLEVTANGVRRPLKTVTRSGSITQAHALVSYLRVVAQENNIPPQSNIDWATTAES
jgi:S-DNA-T family DNA segregation ATPase FtsK/SpoIIIE